MAKKVMSQIDYTIRMILVMVVHDKAGAMESWVNGTVRVWLIKLLSHLEQNPGDYDIRDRLGDDGVELVVRVVNTIPEKTGRILVFSTMIQHNIVSIDDIPKTEADHVKLVPVD